MWCPLGPSVALCTLLMYLGWHRVSSVAELWGGDLCTGLSMLTVVVPSWRKSKLGEQLVRRGGKRAELCSALHRRISGTGSDNVTVCLQPIRGLTSFGKPKWSKGIRGSFIRGWKITPKRQIMNWTQPMKVKYNFTKIRELGRFFTWKSWGGATGGQFFPCGMLSGKKTPFFPFFRPPSRNTMGSCYNKSNTNAAVILHTEPDFNMSLIFT